MKEIDNDGVVSLLVKTPRNAGRLSVLVSRVVGVLNVATLQHLCSNTHTHGGGGGREM